LTSEEVFEKRQRCNFSDSKILEVCSTAAGKRKQNTDTILVLAS